MGTYWLSTVNCNAMAVALCLRTHSADISITCSFRGEANWIYAIYTLFSCALIDAIGTLSRVQMYDSICSSSSRFEFELLHFAFYCRASEWQICANFQHSLIASNRISNHMRCGMFRIHCRRDMGTGTSFGASRWLTDEYPNWRANNNVFNFYDRLYVNLSARAVFRWFLLPFNVFGSFCDVRFSSS